MNIEIEKIIKLHAAIEAVKDREDLDFKFSYTLVKNKARIEGVIKAVAAMEKPTARLLEFDKKKLEIANKFRDPNKQSKQGTIALLENKLTEFMAEIKPLEEEYKEDLAAQAAKAVEVAEFIKTKEDVAFFLVDESLFPSKLSVTLVECLEPIMNKSTKN